MRFQESPHTLAPKLNSLTIVLRMLNSGIQVEFLAGLPEFRDQFQSLREGEGIHVLLEVPHCCFSQLSLEACWPAGSGSFLFLYNGKNRFWVVCPRTDQNQEERCYFICLCSKVKVHQEHTCRRTEVGFLAVEGDHMPMGRHCGESR